MFEVAIYTDVSQEESVYGRDGFGFQAISGGIDEQDTGVIRSYLLHTIAPAWDTQHDDLSHPESFTYTTQGGRYYLSRGRSLGWTHDHKRRGNSLTQSIVTADALDFSPLRPAQLFGAVRWSLEKAPSKEIDAWAAPLEIAPDFDSGALSDMVRHDSWARGVLPVFLTMVERAISDRPTGLVVIGQDTRQVMRWIALGSLFVDTERALTMDLRGQVASPLDVSANMIGTTHQFGPRIGQLINDPAVNVIDLDQKAISRIEVSASAQLQAGWFLTEESSAALAAIELARRWERPMGSDLATEAAAVASFPSRGSTPASWNVALQALKILSDQHLSEELFFYGDSLLDAVAGYVPTNVAEAQLAAQTLVATAAAGETEASAFLVVAGLEAVTGSAELSQAWTKLIADSAIEIVWGDGEARAQAARGLAAMLTQTEDSELPQAMSAARVLNLDLAPTQVSGIIQRAGQLWADRPELGETAARWAWSGEIREALAETLVNRWRQADQTALQQLANGSWDWLTEPGLSGWLVAARVGRRPPNERLAELKRLTRPLPPETWRLAWRGISPQRDHALLVWWGLAYGGFEPAASGWLEEQVNQILQGGQPAPGLRDLLLALDRNAPKIRLGKLAAVVGTAGRANQLAEDAINQGETVPNRPLELLADELAQLAPILYRQVGRLALEQIEDQAALSYLIGTAGAWAQIGALEELRQAADSGATPTAWAVPQALHWYLEDPDGPIGKAAREFLLELTDTNAGRKILANAKPLMSKEWLTELAAFEETARSGRGIRNLGRGAKKLFGGRKDQDDG
ncbi:MAG: hypothetical protein LBJ62_10580 [Bifidobacteriaceae bacterium]|jgi:hypothetical protein|nr:hypothetical protein [Bifidobacteriaceae bacterium]